MQGLARACQFRKLLGDCKNMSRIYNPENARKFYQVYQHLFYAVTQPLDGSLDNLALAVTEPEKINPNGLQSCYLEHHHINQPHLQCSVEKKQSTHETLL